MSYRPAHTEREASHAPGGTYDPSTGLDEVTVRDARRWLLNKQKGEKLLLVHEDIQAYVIFLFFVMMTVFYFGDVPGSWDLQNMFIQTYITPAFDANTYPCQNFYEMKNIADFWSWLENPMLTNHFQSCTGTGTDAACVINEYNTVQGSVMMRQKRVDPGGDECSDSNGLTPCYGFLTADNENTTTFYVGTTEYAYVDDTESVDIYGILPLGSAATQEYDNGGFVHYFAQSDYTDFSTTVATLKAGDWVNIQTRAIIIEVNLYNAGYDRYVHGQILIEIAPSGAFYNSAKVWALDIQLDTDWDWNARLICWVGVFVCLWFYGIKLIRQIIKFLRWQNRVMDMHDKISLALDDFDATAPKGCDRYWKLWCACLLDQRYWGWLDMVMLVMWVATLIVNLITITVLNNETSAVDPTTNMLYLSDCAYWYKISIYLLGVSCFLTLFKATRFCYISVRLTLLCEAIQEALTDLLAFMILFFLIFIAFACSAHILFGADSDIFSTFLNTMSAQIGMLYGHVNVNELERLNKYMGPFYFYMFLIIMSLILMNTFIGIIAASILDVRRKTAENARGTDLAEWFTQRFVRVKKVLPASGTDLTSSCVAVCGHVKQLAKYAVFGEYNPTPPKLGPLLAVIVPVVVKMIDVCEARTRTTDHFCDVTLAKDDFINLLSQILKDTQESRKISNDITILAKDAWDEMMTWILRNTFDDNTMTPFDPKDISEYEMMAEMHSKIKSLHSRMGAEMSVLRASQREVLRATHSIENQVSGSGFEQNCSMGARYQAYTELFEALDDRTFAHEERHLDKLYLERIMAQFQIAIRGATPGAQMDKPEVEMQMAGNSTGEGGKKQLDVRVSEISLMSMSTLPLFRDNVFCQVEVCQDVSNPQFGGAAKLYQRTKSVSSTSNDKSIQIDNFSVLGERNHTFKLPIKALTFSLENVRFVSVKFVVYHEVLGIRTIELCSGQKQFNLTNDPLVSGTVDLHRHGLGHEFGSKLGDLTFETSWKCQESSTDQNMLDTSKTE